MSLILSFSPVEVDVDRDDGLARVRGVRAGDGGHVLDEELQQHALALEKVESLNSCIVTR